MSTKSPNVVLIISDTFRRDHLGCYGNDWIRTPNLDRLAAESLVFDRAYASSFPTVPARRDFLTGRHSAAYSVWAPLPPDETVLAECLRPSGYTSMMVADLPTYYGYHYDRGFDGREWIRGQMGDGWRTDPVDADLPDDIPLRTRAQIRRYLPNIRDRFLEEDYTCARTMTAAGRWLEQNRARSNPFFLYIDTFDPHEPWDPPQQYLDLYRPGSEAWDFQLGFARYEEAASLKPGELEVVRALYAAEVTLVDRWVGLLLERLKYLGRWDDTVVIFASDHGFLHGEHGYVGKAILREDAEGQITFSWLPLWEELARVPLMVKVPDGPTGRTDALVQFPDLMPTILELAGAQIPPTVQGRSFASVLRGESTAHRDIGLSFPALLGGGFGGARITATTDRWSYISPGSPIEGSYSVAGLRVGPDVLRRTYAVDGVAKQIEEPAEVGDELYDLAEDPEQMSNVAGKYSDVVDDLRAEIVRGLAGLGAAPEIVNAWKTGP